MPAIQNARLKNPSTAIILLPSTELDFQRTLLSVQLLPRTRYKFIYLPHDRSWAYCFLIFVDKRIFSKRRKISNTIAFYLFNQIEGAAHRALNGWDYYTHRYPGYKPINYPIDQHSFGHMGECINIRKTGHAHIFLFVMVQKGFQIAAPETLLVIRMIFTR